MSGSIWGVVKTWLHIVIYKCNNFPREYFSEAPPPKIYLTLFALPYIMGVKGDIMPKIYERNPDTNEVRSYERVKPSPYRNEMEEAVEILKRIESKLQYICEVGVSKSDTTPYSTWKEYNE